MINVSMSFKPKMCSVVGRGLAPLTLLIIGLFSAPISAQEANADFKVTGFLSVVGGKILQGGLDSNYAGSGQIAGYDCACYVADWSNAGVYTKSFSLKPESRVGVQLSYKPNTSTSFIAQVVSRGTDGTPNLQWAYAGYKLDSQWEIQAGRKRIPLYYYSDFQDVSLSYPWITPPPELYGWEATNYNGASVRYNGTVGAATLNGSVFLGSEKVKDSLYQKLYYTGKSEVSWRNLVGGDLELAQGMLTVRGVYLQADVRSKIFDFGIDDVAKLKAYGIAVNLDFDDWFVLSELTQLKRNFTQSAYTVTAPALTIGAGMRMGAWTPFVNYAQYIEASSDEAKYIPQKFKRTSITVRYDLDSNSALKAQIDRHKDTSNNFGGNSTVLRFSYDRVF
jgi:predicted porin